MQINPQTPIPLIVGAGPTGLILSLWLQKFSVPHRIVDIAPKAGAHSRAIVVHAKTLEFYRQLDLDEALIAAGTKVDKFGLHHSGILRTTIPFGECGQGLSKYPFSLAITQDKHEALLERTLVERGGKVDRGVEVTDVEEIPGQHRVIVTMTNNGKTETFHATYVIGCDGTHSKVRRSANIAMEGGTYASTFFVADISATGLPQASNQINLFLSNTDFLVAIPLATTHGHVRLIGQVPPDVIEYDDITPAIRKNADHITVDKVSAFSRYRCHYRTASAFQESRIFLCGDAAHVHSPVGGQGMNTGLGDASNLAWKLAHVHHGTAPAAILHTYEQERMPFAKLLVKTTDWAFSVLTTNSWIGSFLRNWYMVYIVPFLVWGVGFGRIFFRMVSQIEVEFSGSALSVDLGRKGGWGMVRAGKRLPWVQDVDGEVGDNHALLTRAEWQVHVYGTVSSWVEDYAKKRDVPLHCFAWREDMGKQGLRQNVLYLIRPDGYIGLMMAEEEQEANKIELDAYFEKWTIGKSG